MLSSKILVRLGIACVCVLGIAAVSMSSASKFTHYWSIENVSLRDKTKKELVRLNLLKNLPKETLTELFDYQCETGFSLATILRDRQWSKKLGLTSTQYKGTWYAANPYELLPSDLQEALRLRKTPLLTQDQAWKWINTNHFPASWKKSLAKAFIETTPENLWRAAQGQRPVANNGEYLEPIVFQRSPGEFEVRDGHIATDPKIIPTNSEVFVILKIKGEDRILRVKATDVGGGIRGKHVDLPIHLNSNAPNAEPYITFPSEIKNATVTILAPVS